MGYNCLINLRERLCPSVTHRCHISYITNINQMEFRRVSPNAKQSSSLAPRRNKYKPLCDSSDTSAPSEISWSSFIVFHVAQLFQARLSITFMEDFAQRQHNFGWASRRGHSFTIHLPRFTQNKFMIIIRNDPKRLYMYIQVIYNTRYQLYFNSMKMISRLSPLCLILALNGQKNR